MKALAVLLNIGAIIFLASIVVLSNRLDQEEWIILSYFAILSVVSIIAILGGDKESWIGLYFKRKRLEEKQKIDKLSSK